jgi:hypothetical protein
VTVAELDPRTHARRADPITSHLAARQLSDKATMLRALLSAYLDADGLTADEATIAADYGPSDGAWKRISDLAALGLIADTGERRQGLSGREQIVRAITHDGVVALAKGGTP